MDSLAALSFFALSPILVVGILLVGLRWPAKTAMPVGWSAQVEDVPSSVELRWRLDEHQATLTF